MELIRNGVFRLPEVRWPLKGVRAARQNWTVKGCFRCSYTLGALGWCAGLCCDSGHQSRVFGAIDRFECMTGVTPLAPSYTLRTPGRRTGRVRQLRRRFRMTSLDGVCGSFKCLGKWQYLSLYPNCTFQADRE